MSSPLVQRLLGMWDDKLQTDRYVGRQTMLDQRQREEDARRRAREDEAAQMAKFVNDLAIANFIRENKAAIPVEEPAAATAPNPAALEAITKLFTGPAPVATEVPPPAAHIEAPLPQMATEVPPPEPPPVVPAPIRPDRVNMTLPDGRQIPLATMEEQAAWKNKQLEAETTAKTRKWDVPNNPELFGDLAGQKQVPLDVVQTVVSALGRKEQIEANKLFREANANYKKETDAAKLKDKEHGAKVMAQAWRDGRAYPTSNEGTTDALQYMDAHPQEFPRLPRKLTALQATDMLRSTDTLATLADVKKAYEKVKGTVGPWNYQWNELQQRIPGTKSNPDFATFNTLLRGMQSMEIKRITGAQMSEFEATRLLKGMATGTLKQDEFEAALKVMERNARVNREILMYGDVLTPPEIIEVPWETKDNKTAPGGVKPVDKESLLNKYYKE